MKKRKMLLKASAIFLALLLVAPEGVPAQNDGGERPFSQEELDQLVAPIALYPDELLAQIFMASTYPLEVVQAARWAKQNEGLKGDALADALEQQNWDPSVKSLVNFPQVLQMMNERLEWTQQLGDAFLGQQKDVMETVQKLRAKAEAEGNLQSNKEQKVIVQKETQTIVIQPANPQVVYVPVYNPTVVYGPWWYPAYPPYYYHPPGYVPGAALFSFGVGVAVGAAWGYAWGGCNWGRNEVNININRNTNINTRIDRSKYSNRVTTGGGGRGSWKHNPEHRRGASYRNQATAQKYNKGMSKNAQSREAFRGRAEAGRQQLASRGSTQSSGRPSSGRQTVQGGGQRSSTDRSKIQQPKVSGGSQRTGTQPRMDKSAFGNYERGSQTKNYSTRGRQSMSSSPRSSGMGRSSGGMSRGSGGMSRGGGGMGRGGGGRR